MLKGSELTKSDLIAVQNNALLKNHAVLRHLVSGDFTSWEIFCALCMILCCFGMYEEMILFVCKSFWERLKLKREKL